MILHLFALGTIVVLASGYALPTREAERGMHPVYKADAAELRSKRASMPVMTFPSLKVEQYAEYWRSIANQTLEQQLESKMRLNTQLAKNIMLFLGDGMSIPTITAGRVYLGGEEKQFAFEQFPYVGLSKTYCANMQVADSACTATAYLCGVKANYGTVGVTAAVHMKDCFAQSQPEHQVASIAEWAQRQGMATGLITTTSVTHASPAGIYAHIANRNWENDADVQADGADPSVCADIASQLVYGPVGQNLNVILGGGRENFLPEHVRDTSGQLGRRKDGRNLIEEWRRQHTNSAHYVYTRRQLLELSNQTSRVLGLFAPYHMPYHLDSNAEELPTLEEMVQAAMDILERQSGGRGYFLFVEGGRIDHGHHDTLALRAIDETAEFDKSVRWARTHSSVEDTLIVVTSDHSHTMSLAGYSSRKNDIFGINDGQLAADDLPYATLSYANGPGYNSNYLREGGAVKRKNLRAINMKNKDFMFPTAVPLESETHGGDDVAVFASGPYAQLFSGVYEQHFIPHAMAYASCLSESRSMCSDTGISRRIR
ncbi:alkaline phosphatase [Drosophila grimshawi]|uniref:Alkaline phosphatase n=1 Tax=Drosophila grimshawi TaxID=7222 RepID=B4JEK3_DROGR|nr:alkaline phosphatase [Drosophila grimshawi]EDV93134.1 GH18436 [Drosophila grimshawi]